MGGIKGINDLKICIIMIKTQYEMYLEFIHIPLVVKLYVDVFMSALRRKTENILFTVSVSSKHSRLSCEESNSLCLLKSDFFLIWIFFFKLNILLFYSLIGT